MHLNLFCGKLVYKVSFNLKFILWGIFVKVRCGALRNAIRVFIWNLINYSWVTLRFQFSTLQNRLFLCKISRWFQKSGWLSLIVPICATTKPKHNRNRLYVGNISIIFIQLKLIYLTMCFEKPQCVNIFTKQAYL